jgi:5'(3')-deoxyribonucleotidase
MQTIYLDMDGVVADFDAEASKIIGRSHSANERWPDHDWIKLRAFPRFYRDLPLMPDARRLVATVLDLADQTNRDVRFLTAVPQDNDFPWAFQDKVTWKQRHFGDIPIWFGPYSHDKQLWARPGDILIDDRRSNIEQWQAAGGHGILHHGDVDQSLDQLRTIIQTGV